MDTADREIILGNWMKKPCCGSKNWRKPCTPDTCEWYIKAPKYFNCFLVYKHYIHENEHTLQEVAKLMDISHTTVKQIESQALDKIKALVANGEVTLEQVQQIFQKTED